jgi:hypothetical protein
MIDLNLNWKDSDLPIRVEEEASKSELESATVPLSFLPKHRHIDKMELLDRDDEQHDNSDARPKLKVEDARIEQSKYKMSSGKDLLSS